MLIVAGKKYSFLLRGFLVEALKYHFYYSDKLPENETRALKQIA